MAKYVIEIEDVPFGRNDDPVIPHGMDELYRARGFKSLVFDQNGLNKLTPYTEPDEDEIRQRVEQEVWEFADKYYNMNDIDFDDCCDSEVQSSYSEAKAKYEEWRKQKDEIRVGDEVTFKPNDAKGIVIWCHVPDVYADVDKYAVFTGNFVEYCPIEWLTKTGRVFPEVAELLKKMKEE